MFKEEEAYNQLENFNFAQHKKPMKKYLNNLLRMSELINIEFDPWVDILLVELDLIRREITSNEKVSQKEISREVVIY